MGKSIYLIFLNLTQYVKNIILIGNQYKIINQLV